MSRKLNSLKTVVSLLMAFLTAILVPIQVGAQIPFPDTQSSISENADDEQSQPIGTIVAELTEKRNETTKYFKLDDGSFIAALYDLPVHYKDESGNYIDYDNRLEEYTVSDEAVSSFADLPDENNDCGTNYLDETIPSQTNENNGIDETTTENHTEYKVKKSNLDVRFSNKTKEHNMVKFGKGQYKISWGFSDTNRSSINIESSQESHQSGNDSFLNVPNLTQTVSYNNAYDGVDLQYIISSNGIKENIILQNAEAKKSYLIEYRFQKLTPVQKDSKTIILQNNKNEEVYRLSAPVMTDHSGATNTEISLTLIEQKNNKFTVLLSVDESWVTAPERSFPIVIDPDIQTNQNWGTVQSSYVDSAEPSIAHGSTSGGIYCSSL